MTADLDAVQQLLAQGRLSVDRCVRGRTTFFSHLGAAPRLVPGAWLGHRDLLFALALANLTPAQRQSLARAVLVEHGREFGVGRLALTAVSSDLPLGGSSLRLQPRGGGPVCLYTWALGPEPAATPCEWLLLRAQPEWAHPSPPPPLRADALSTLHALGLDVHVVVATAVEARQVAQRCLVDVPFTAHPRFLPHLDGHDPHARVRLHPHDAVDARGLGIVPKDRSKPPPEASAIVLVDAPEALRRQVNAWLAGVPHGRRVELVEATCPGRADRDALQRLWTACGRPSVLLRGDPAWTGDAGGFLRELGARVEAQGEGTQLGLFA